MSYLASLENSRISSKGSAEDEIGDRVARYAK